MFILLLRMPLHYPSVNRTKSCGASAVRFIACIKPDCHCSSWPLSFIHWDIHYYSSIVEDV